MRALRDYPRPPSDTGIGVHWGSGDTRPEHVRQHLPLLMDLGVSWVKMLGKGNDGDVEACGLLAAAGIEPVVRLYTDRPHPQYVPPRDLVKRYVNAGAHYFEGGNEPNLFDEWQLDAWNLGYQPNQVAEQWLRFRMECRLGGGIPLLYALSPGGHIHHTTFFRQMLAHLAALNGGNLQEVLAGCALASHPRPLNHPLNYPRDRGLSLDVDSTGWLAWRWYEDRLREYGVVIPQIATEHGYEPGWHQDDRYPPISRELHMELNRALARQVNNGIEVSDAFFAGCFWLLGGQVLGNRTFQFAAWLDSDYPPGGELPIVGAMRAARWPPRVFGWARGAGLTPGPSPVGDGNVLTPGPSPRGRGGEAIGLNPDTGFARARDAGLIRPREGEIYHFPGSEHQVSLMVGEDGYATHDPRTNATVIHRWLGGRLELWTDDGNDGDGSGRFRRLV